MNKKYTDSCKTILIIVLIGCFLGAFEQLPWWSFLVPVYFFGVFIAGKNWSVNSFAIGFLSGFILWSGANIYFDNIYDGVILNKTGVLLSVNGILILLIAGLAGGLLSALSLYAGSSTLFISSSKDR